MKGFKIGMLTVLMGVLCGMFFLQAAKAESVQDIQTLIEKLEVGEAVYYENLTILPLYYIKPQGISGYPTLDEALDNKWLEITEVEGGRVPEVMINNLSDKYIFLMGGEIITGCKQDRIVGKDVLLGPKVKNVLVPVYCVEQGRWTHNSQQFYSKNNLGTFKLRSSAQYQARSSQSDIWRSVSEANSKMGIDSRTNAYQELYDNPNVRQQIVNYEKKMQDIPRMHKDTIGVVVGLGEKIVSVDIFTSPLMFNKLWPKLLKSTAVAAMCNNIKGSVNPEDAAGFLRKLYNKDFAKRSAVNEGIELYAVDDEINGNALLFANNIIHLAVFSQDKNTTDSYSDQVRGRRIPVMQQR